jgi:hypothetical protein
MQQRTTVWMLVAAVSVGWLVGPRVVSAATSLVRIQDGSDDTKAKVTDNHQLQVAEAAPSSFREYAASNSDSSCHVMVTVPSDKGLILRSVSFDVITPSSGGFEFASIYANGTCSGSQIVTAPTHNRGTNSVSIEPGFAIASGGKLSFQVGNDSVTAVSVWGYVVPKADVPSTTTIG